MNLARRFCTIASPSSWTTPVPRLPKLGISVRNQLSGAPLRSADVR